MSERTILIVDDNPVVRQAVRQALEQAGHIVVEFENGHEALASVRVTPPDLVISDIEMPKFDGFGLCQIIRSLPATRRLPFLFLTSHTSDRTRSESARRGADDFIAKPFDPEDLVLRVATLLAECG